MKYIGHKKIEGIIEVITGLHIGGSTTVIEIGGKDNPVIKHPLNKEPYIPGSSLKGKMRSLLEWKYGLINDSNPKEREFGEVHQCADPKCPVCVIFGSSKENPAGPTRLTVRDAFIDEKYKDQNKKKNIDWIPMDILEDKYENTINRITAKANPRNFERVVSGVKFSFEMIFRIFERNDNGSNDLSLFSDLLAGLKLIESDSLGGAGSRGCGQVRFHLQLPGIEQPQTLDKINEETFQKIKLVEI